MKRLYLLIILILSIQVYAANLKFKDLYGHWILKYKNSYGYEFRFKKNYIAYSIIYLNNSVYVFKGVYTIEGENRFRIKINQWKNQSSRRAIEDKKNFENAVSSYFVFDVVVQRKKGRPMLMVSPKKIIIDGRQSDGFFEPEIVLRKIK